MIKKGLIFLLFMSLFFACNSKEDKNVTAIQKLEEGNKRFSSGKPVHPDETLERLHELSSGQSPFAIVVSCSDSRVPVELIFDQGLGDIFTIRTAGNVIGDYELGSIEYAVEHLDCKLIVVLGHKKCGAVKAFIESKGKYTHNDHIKKIIEYIEKEKEENSLIQNHQLSMDNAVSANVVHAVNYLKKSEPILKERFNSKKLMIVGAVYDIETGMVDFEMDKQTVN